MKNTSRYLIAAIVLTLFGSSELLAQTVQLHQFTKLPNREQPSPFETDTNGGTTVNQVKSKAVRDFSRRALSAEKQQWYRFTDGYLVKYEDSKGINCRTDYDKLGNWISTTRYYGAEHLGAEMRRVVSSIYLDFTITTVQEINFPRHTVYVIHMHNDDQWQNLQVANGELTILEQRQKTALD